MFCSASVGVFHSGLRSHEKPALVIVSRSNRTKFRRKKCVCVQFSVRKSEKPDNLNRKLGPTTVLPYGIVVVTILEVKNLQKCSLFR